MKNFCRAFIVFYGTGFFVNGFGGGLGLIDFDKAMDNGFYIRQQVATTAAGKRFRERYTQFIADALPRSSNTLIPKIIHQIWLGSKLPKKFKKLTKTWRINHPDWLYVLWTDKEAATFDFIHKNLYHATTNYGAKSDIFRYEILYRMGGLYVDTDFECMKPFDELHHYLDFYAGCVHIEQTKDQFDMINALIACSPRHPVIEQCMNDLAHAAINPPKSAIPNNTGPSLLTRAFLQVPIEKLARSLILPARYVYPIPESEAHEARMAKSSTRPSRKVLKAEYVKKETYAIHYSAMSWLNPGFTQFYEKLH